MSLRAVGEAAGLSHAYIAAAERAEPSANLTIKALEAITAALGLSVEVLVGDDRHAELYAVLSVVPDDRIAMVRAALLSLASLPADELELEADMLSRRAARSAHAAARPTGT